MHKVSSEFSWQLIKHYMPVIRILYNSPCPCIVINDVNIISTAAAAKRKKANSPDRPALQLTMFSATLK